MDFLKRISDFLWNESFWLPMNVSWRDLTHTPERPYPSFHALLYPIPLALFVYLVRLTVEKVIYEPIGRSLRIPCRKAHNVSPNPILEASYKWSRRLTHADILGLAKRCDMTERQVERWFRHRNAIRRGLTSQLDKFKETGWRFTFYLGIFLYGVWVLSDKPWFQDSSYVWTEYPFQIVTSDVWWYYMIELSFYWSLLFTQFFDVKRKDFWEMFFHHIITITLMCFSWIDNTVRIGTLVLVLHDVSDFWLEGAKLARYAKMSRLSSMFFAIFAAVWIVTRLGVYPYRILSYTFPCPLGEKCFPAFHLYNTLLGSLQILHIFWTFTILRVIYRALNTGETEDVRSDTDESENEASDDYTSPSKSEIGTGDGVVRENGNGCLLSGQANGDLLAK
ncbi:Ceramide synthase 2 [Hypsibius exemplaris]|uniref:Ceramide synthase 2 n=1 Tax=Hypsibius exemplaris TaxID=2072580 RepID=A0A1W0WZR1_HYPEX|nr:Ceramide synthase 2 [Hypsibius exemplaris]